MTRAEFKRKLQILEAIAASYKWAYVSNDFNTGRVTFKDQYSVYRMDVYTTKMTVCLMVPGNASVYLKKQTLESITNVFCSPHDYES